MKKLLLSVMVLMLLPVSAAAFSDVPEAHWAAEDIDAMVEQHVITGYPDDTFRPEDTVSRAQFLSMLIRAVSDESVPLAEEGEAWWQPYFDRALELGILSDAGGFPLTDIQDMDGDISRAEMAQLLFRTDSRNFSFRSWTRFDASAFSFSDTDGTVQEAAAGAAATGLLTGFSDGLFHPEQAMTRAQACTVIRRLLDHDGLLDSSEYAVAFNGACMVKYHAPDAGTCTLYTVSLSTGETLDSMIVSRQSYDQDGTWHNGDVREALGANDGWFWGYGGLYAYDAQGQLTCLTDRIVIDWAQDPADGSLILLTHDDRQRMVPVIGGEAYPCGNQVIRIAADGTAEELLAGGEALLDQVTLAEDGTVRVRSISDPGDGTVQALEYTVANGRLLPVQLPAA